MSIFFDLSRFMPHGHCFQWDPGILWSSVISDSLIAISYFAIPFTLVFQIMRKRGDLPFNWMFLCFGVFIVACGSTHIMDVIVTWEPAYGLAAVIKAITAIASVPTAIILYRIAPRIVSLPTVEEVAREQTLRVQAEAANQAKDRFIAMLSHELRTPLTPVTAGLAIVDDELRKVDGAADTTSAREALQMIRQNVEMERILIDDLLDLSGLRHGKLGLSRDRVDLDQVCRDSVRHLQPGFERKGIALILDLPVETIPVTGDKARLHQILNNLLSNALKHTPEGGRVAVRLAQDRDRVRMQVQDSGSGIAPEDVDRIFLPFEQVERRGRSGRAGLGLGLSIAKSLAQAMGGELSAASEGLQRGATFELILPAGASGSRTEVSPAPVPLGNEEKKPMLLLVDDHPDTLRALSLILGRSGYPAVTAATFGEAEALLPECELLISDIDLPDGDGCELMRRFKAGGGRAGIAISGFGSEEDLRRTHEAGFNRSFVKPIEASELLEAIRALRPALEAKN
jgi:signal transduction histidine kinase/CheY-like chemotaxis protein